MNSEHRSIRPQETEYAHFYRGYVSLVGDGDIVDTLESQRDAIQSLGSGLSGERETWRYAEGKWSVREVFGHLLDVERVFAYRLLCIARGEQQELPGFDEDAYNRNSRYGERAASSILEEFDLVRRSTILMIDRLDPDLFSRRGVANRAEITVRAIAWIMAGHPAHHLRILRERYELAR